MAEHSVIAAGIDTAKAKLDIAVHGTNTRLTIDNTPDGWHRLLAVFNQHGVGKVGIEATGGYERGVVNCLRQHGLVVLVLQPLQVKAYARLHLRRAKNDRIDAVLIAACTAVLDPPDVAPDPRLVPLCDRLTWIEQLAEDAARWKTRIEHARDPWLHQQILAEIKRLKAQAAAERQHLLTAVRRHDDLARRFELILGIDGIGEATALVLLLRMPELGRVTREQAAALAGLAPFDDDTGQHHGERHIEGGRDRVRRALYAAAFAASAHWNPALVAFYRRLRANGKSHKAAVVACARKLLIFANTVLARGTPWLSQHPAA